MIYFYAGLFAIIFVFVILNILHFKKDMNTAYSRLNSLGSRLIDTEYGAIEYASHGSGYPILVIHGAMGGFDQGLSVADDLIGPNYQSICVSRFGYLRSDLPENPTLNKQADAYNSLLAAINVPKCAVFGISGGATSAIRFVARHQEHVSALILLSPAAPGKEMPDTPPKFVFNTLLRSDFIYWASVTYGGSSMNSFVGVPKNFKLTSEQQSEIKETLIETMPSSKKMNGMISDMYYTSDEFYRSITDESPYPLDKINVPVLVINAKDDELALPANVENLAGKFSDSRLFRVLDGGHELLGHKEEVKSEITEFLNNKTTEQECVLQYPVN